MIFHFQVLHVLWIHTVHMLWNTSLEHVNKELLFHHTLKFIQSRLGLQKVHLWGDPENHTTCKCVSNFIPEFCWLDWQIYSVYIVHVPHLSAVPVCLVFAAWHLQDLCQGRPQWSKSGQKSSPKRVSCNSNIHRNLAYVCVHMCMYLWL